MAKRTKPPTRQEMANQARMWKAYQLCKSPAIYARLRQTIAKWIPDSASARRIADRGAFHSHYRNARSPGRLPDIA